MEVKLPSASEINHRAKVAGKCRRPLDEALFTLLYRAADAGNDRKAIWPDGYTQELVDYAKDVLPGLGYKITNFGESGGIVISWSQSI